MKEIVLGESDIIAALNKTSALFFMYHKTHIIYHGCDYEFDCSTEGFIFAIISEVFIEDSIITEITICNMF